MSKVIQTDLNKHDLVAVEARNITHDSIWITNARLQCPRGTSAYNNNDVPPFVCINCRRNIHTLSDFCLQLLTSVSVTPINANKTQFLRADDKRKAEYELCEIVASSSLKVKGKSDDDV